MTSYTSNMTIKALEVTSPSRSALIASFSLYLLPLVVGIAGNAGLLQVIVSHKSLRTGPNAYIANMAALEFLACALLVPLRMVFYLAESTMYKGGLVLCQTEVFFHSLVDAGRMLFLAAVSFERYQAVANPFQRDKTVAARRAAITLGILWAFMLLCSAVIAAYLFDTIMFEFCLIHTTTVATDYRLWGGIEVYFMLPLSVLTILVVVICYSLMFRLLHTQSNKMLNHTSKVAPAPPASVHPAKTVLPLPEGGSKASSADVIGTSVTTVSARLSNSVPEGSQNPESRPVISPQSFVYRGSETEQHVDASSASVGANRTNLAALSPVAENQSDANVPDDGTKLMSSMTTTTKTILNQSLMSQSRQGAPASSLLSKLLTGIHADSASSIPCANTEKKSVNSQQEQKDIIINVENSSSRDIQPLTSSSQSKAVTDVYLRKSSDCAARHSLLLEDSPSSVTMSSLKCPLVQHASQEADNQSGSGTRSHVPCESNTSNSAKAVHPDSVSSLYSVSVKNSKSRCTDQAQDINGTYLNVVDEFVRPTSQGQDNAAPFYAVERRRCKHTPTDESKSKEKTSEADNAEDFKMKSSCSFSSSDTHITVVKSSPFDKKVKEDKMGVVDEDNLKDFKREFEESQHPEQAVLPENISENYKLQKTISQREDVESTSIRIGSSAKSYGLTDPGEMADKAGASTSTKSRQAPSCEASDLNKPAAENTGVLGDETQKKVVKTVQVVEMDGTQHVEQVVGDQNIQGAVCMFNPSNRMQGRRRVELKVAKRLVIVFLTFLFLWLPYPIAVLILRVVHVHPGERSQWQFGMRQDTVDVIAVLSALTTVTAAVNPVLYGLSNVNIRSIVLKKLKSSSKCCKSRS